MAVEKTTPRDHNKMVRLLSLVAYMMAKDGRWVEPEAIRAQVEGYGDDMSWESFTRSFHRDREELARLGIDIEHGTDEFGEGELYRLPPENYFLPAVEFSREELAALNTCLLLLEGQFAYSRTMRLALTGLALGTGTSPAEPDLEHYSVDLAGSGYDGELAERLRSIEKAYSRRKTIVFDYYALSHDSTETRTVDPYAMMVTRGDWYLVGHSHEREGIRIFKIKRMRGKIRMPSKNDNNYVIPEDFRVADYTNLEPWQLGPARGEAVIEFSPRQGWWAEANLSRSGKVERRQDGSAVLTTAYSDGGPLCSLVLGMYRDARLIAPAALRTRLLEMLAGIESDHCGEPPRLSHPLKKQPREKSAPRARENPQVPPERLAQMMTVISYLMQRVGDDYHVVIDAGELMGDLGFASRQEMEGAMDLIRLVNFSAGSYVVWPEVSGDEVRVEGWPDGLPLSQPAHLSPREARALVLAIDLLGSQTLGGQDPSLDSAREKIMKAAGGLTEGETIAVGETEKEDRDICRTIHDGMTQHRQVEMEYLSFGAASPVGRVVEPHRIIKAKGQWYLQAWCHERSDSRTFRFEMIKSARLMDEEFTHPVPESGSAGDRDASRYPSGKKPPHMATVWFREELSRWVREKHGDVTELADGTLLGHIPFFDEEWLISEVLGYGGQAVLIEPAGTRKRIAKTAADVSSRCISAFT